jgi:Zn-dependent peptidase ImmA (M78 family)
MRLLELDPIQAEANRIREVAGIGIEDVVPDVVTVLRRLGLAVALRHLGREGLDGIYGTSAGAGWVVLNSAKFVHRLRCVGAHLLAHHVFGDEPHVDHDIGAVGSDPAQQRANAFAARLLVTREAIWARREHTGALTEAESIDLACAFGVEHRVMVERLREVGIA